MFCWISQKSWVKIFSKTRSGRVISLWCLALLMILLQSVLIGKASAQGELQESKGGFDLEHVEELGLYFAEESTRRLYIPITFRIVALAMGEKISRKEELEKIRENPPKADANGVVHPFGSSNPLSLVYNSETRSMTAWERFIRYRHGVGYYGFTGPELAAGLNKVARKKDLAGGSFAFDPLKESISLKREYKDPPQDLDKFYDEINQLVKAYLRWIQKSELFLENATAAAKLYAPPASASATHNGFSAVMTLRHFSVPYTMIGHYIDKYAQYWEHRRGNTDTLLVSDSEMFYGQGVSAFIHFKGALDDSEGKAAVEVTYSLKGPNGNMIFDNHTMPIWWEAAPPGERLQLGRKNLLGGLGYDLQPGQYQMGARVCSQPADNCVDLEIPFSLAEKPESD